MLYLSAMEKIKSWMYIEIYLNLMKTEILDFVWLIENSCIWPDIQYYPVPAITGYPVSGQNTGRISGQNTIPCNPT